jgi:hypothetical protein
VTAMAVAGEQEPALFGDGKVTFIAANGKK